MHTNSNAQHALRIMALTGLVSIASIGAVSAQQANSNTRAGQFYGFYQQNPAAMNSPARADRADFDRSGTRGREGLGASPYHPEGPGNVTD